METQDILKLKIGTKEKVGLKPETVKIVGTKVEMQKDKSGKEIGDKVVFLCKHPDKEEIIKISSVQYIRNSKVTDSGTWATKDEDGLISKQSALSNVMNKLGIETLEQAEGKGIVTVLDEKGYLTFKAY